MEWGRLACIGVLVLIFLCLIVADYLRGRDGID
jgi:hypothetical protein